MIIAKSRMLAIENLVIAYRIVPVGVRFLLGWLSIRLPAYFQIPWSLSFNEEISS